MNIEEISKSHDNSIDKNIDITKSLIDLEDLSKLVPIIELIATRLSPGSCMCIRGRCLQNIILTHRFDDYLFNREYSSKSRLSKFSYDKLLFYITKVDNVSLVETHISGGNYVIVLRKK